MNTQAFNYGPVARETVYSTLASLLQTGMGLTTVYRTRVNVQELNANVSPVGMLSQAHGRAFRPKESAPTRYLDTCVFTCAVAQQSVNPTYVAATQLNTLRDLLDLALKPDEPDVTRCTLGGIVDYVRPVSDYYGETVQNGVFTQFATTLEILYTPLNVV